MLSGSCKADSRRRDTQSAYAWYSGCTQSAAFANTLAPQMGQRSSRLTLDWICSDTHLSCLSPYGQASQAERRLWRISLCSVWMKWHSPDGKDALIVHRFHKLFQASAWLLFGWAKSPKSCLKVIRSRAVLDLVKSGVEWSLESPAALLYLLWGARCERPPARLCLFKWQMSQTSGSTRDPINWWSCNKLRLSNILMALCTTCPRR